MTTKATSAAVAHRPIGPRNILVAVLVLELLTVLWGLLFGRMSILFRDPLEPAQPDIAAVVAKVQAVCHPLLVFTALAFVATGRLRHAIVTLGVLEVTRWLNYLLWIVQNGGRLDDALFVQWSAAQMFFLPLMAAGAVTLSLLGKRLGLAAVLISAPMLYNLVSFILVVLWLQIAGP
jgi:hypothetical protein